MKRNLLSWLLAGLAGGAVGGRVVAATLDTIAWKVPSYTLTARAMDVREALDAFGVAQGVPVLCSAAVSGAFSGNFKDLS